MARDGTRRGERPPSISQKQIDTVLLSLRVGNFATVACANAGIPRSTYYAWLERGRRDRDEGRAKSVYRDLLDNVEKAEADAEARIVANLVSMSQRSPQAALGFLAVRFRERWSPSQRLEVSGPHGGPLEILGGALGQIPDDVLERRIEILAKQIGEGEEEIPDGG